MDEQLFTMSWIQKDLGNVAFDVPGHAHAANLLSHPLLPYEVLVYLK